MRKKTVNKALKCDCKCCRNEKKKCSELWIEYLSLAEQTSWFPNIQYKPEPEMYRWINVLKKHNPPQCCSAVSVMLLIQILQLKHQIVNNSIQCALALMTECEFTCIFTFHYICLYL